VGERAQIGLQVLVVLAVLAAGVVGIVVSVGSQPPPVAGRTIAPPDASLIASTLRSPGTSPTAPPSPAPTFATLPPSATPTPTPRPIAMRPYSLNGRSYTGVTAEVGTVFVAGFDARVEVIVYQIIDGEFRTDTNLADRPEYPYVFLYTSERVMKLRPGALKTDTEILVRTSQVQAGDPLFRIIGTQPSSWHYRYDATVTYQVLVSHTSRDETTDFDAKPFIRAQ
jgi:hypothetical protein